MKRTVIVAATLVLLPGILRADPKPILPPEIAWIPPNCSGFIHVWFADLWKSQVGKFIRDAAAKSDSKVLSRIEASFGIKLSQIDRFTIVVSDALDDDLRNSLVLRITTIDPYDWKQVLEALGAPIDLEPDLLSKAMVKLPESRGFVHRSGDRSLTLAFSADGGLDLFGKLLERKTEGPMTPMLKRAAEGHLIVAAASQSILAPFHKTECPDEYVAILEGNTAILIGDLTPNGIRLEAQLGFADAASASVTANVKKVWDDVKRVLGETRVTLKDTKVTAKTDVDGVALLGLLERTVEFLYRNANRKQSQRNLRQITLGLHDYANEHGTLPPSAIFDKNGKALLSWRVGILPFLQMQRLYAKFRLDEPWDSEHNKKLIPLMPKVYLLPGDRLTHKLASTYYRVFVGNNAVFDLRKGKTLQELTAADGTSNTLFIAESADPVPWTKPEDFDYDPSQRPKLGFHHGDLTNIVLGDGSPRSLRKRVSNQELHGMIQYNDGYPLRFSDAVR